MEMAGMDTTESTVAEQRPARVKRGRSDLEKVIAQIEKSCNPFTLMNTTDIHTGKACSENVKRSLLDVRATGRNMHETFVAECVENPALFEKPLRKIKIKTFASDSVGNRRPKNKRLQRMKCTCDLMGRMLIISAKEKLDLKHVLTYPITPVPLALCCSDGKMTKTDKSKLFSYLESHAMEVHQPSIQTPSVIDGNFLLHVMPSKLPKTFSGLAWTILGLCEATGRQRVDIVYDTQRSPSIKDAERGHRRAT
ncbi:Hypothetical predicted protein [Octopus vulgaris]|uniref:Uncharacterized protein n=1 Tax=Octopus vulgaris TaxID=6645 RepID=A0AA36B6W3_OCTVU|nr:Hypothetical predicted protein [Octopus vulgaris]